MVEEVDKLIFNILIGNHELFLPSVGSLYVERESAQCDQTQHLLPPRNVVSFSSQQRGVSLVDAIRQAAGCEERQAQDVYDRYLMQTRVDTTMTIGQVGVLCDKSFRVDAALNRALNPFERRVMKLKPARKSGGLSWIVWLVASCLVVGCGVYFGSRWYYEQKFGTDDEYEFAAAQPVVAQPVVDSVAQPVVDTATLADAVVAEAAAAQTVQPQPEQSPAPAASTEPAKYRVVYGVFSTQKNAETAVAKAQTLSSDARCRIAPMGSKFMVSVFESDDKGDCQSFIDANRASFKDAWVYTRK